MATDAVPPVFGVVVAGRMIRTDFRAVSEREFVLELDGVTPTTSAAGANHLVVLLTGAAPLPDAIGASIYLRWPDGAWHYLGHVANDKPSAIFKLAKKPTVVDASSLQTPIFGGHSSVSESALLGIQLEPLAELRARTGSQHDAAAASRQDWQSEFCSAAAKSLVSHVESYAVRLPHPEYPNAGPVDFVPVQAVNQWYNSWLTRIAQNPDFWRHRSDAV